MKNSLNYEAVFYAKNRAKIKMGFHGNNAVLAKDHVEILARDLKNHIKAWFVGSWDKAPDVLIRCDFKPKTSDTWKLVYKR